MRLLMIRHGETTWNSEKRVQGFSDVTLSERGRRQALAVAEYLRDAALQSVVSSPLLRARETALAVASVHGLPVSCDPDLRELNQGEFEGKTYRELVLSHGSFLEQWMADPAALTVPGGESLPQLQHRAWRALQRIVAQGENAAVVSHSFTIMTILCRMQGLGLDRFRETRVDLASVTEVAVTEGQYRIVRHNDTSHLSDI